MSNNSRSTQVTQNGKYCRKCAPCRSWTRRARFENFKWHSPALMEDLLKVAANAVAMSYESHEEFLDDIGSFLEQHDTHIFDASRPSMTLKATLPSAVRLVNDIPVGISLKLKTERLLRNDFFDCTGYYFHLRRVIERQYGPRFDMTCSSSNDRKSERNLSNPHRYTDPKDFLNAAVRFISRFQRFPLYGRGMQLYQGTKTFATATDLSEFDLIGGRSSLREH
ncbi:hypothetical protein V1508DRAFT_465249 [Lipomyces doorenjongii]|uniref:uncharacterized protein n=1 Tax=Lipomyces doorenjongii TaxID=383834 RepID=UPI0034CF9749